MRNLKLALRTLFKAPFVTGIAILSLALGIGANAAIFSLFNQLLLRGLPVHDAGQLVNLATPGPKQGSTSCGLAGSCDAIFSYPMYRDLEVAELPGLAGLAGHVLTGVHLVYDNQTVNAEGALVSGSYFSVLGARPALGRLLAPADDEHIGGHHVAVLSHSYWVNNLGADPGVLNKPITVNGGAFTIVGVAPEGFHGTTAGVRPRVFIPISMRAELNPTFSGFENRRSYWLYVFGRLAPGATVEQAAASINGVYRPIIREVEAPLQQGFSDRRMAEFRDKLVSVESGRRGQSEIHQQAAVPLTLLLVITGIVLLIACANIANLLLARSANRSMEMAVRLSIGAGRGQLLRQLLTESLLLAAMGGVASLGVAYMTLHAMASILPSDVVTSVDLALDTGVVVVAGALSLATGLLFGIFPALHSTRPDLISTLRANTGQPSGARSAARFRTVLVTAQIGLSMMLLVSAGLFVRSLMNVSRTDLGLEAGNVVTFTISPRLSGYEPERSMALFEEMEVELATVPGVDAVTAGLVGLLRGNNWGTSVDVQGFERTPDTDVHSNYNEVAPGYFSTLGVPLIAGREFTTMDVEGSGKVAVVNEAFAEKFGLGREAIGSFIGISSNGELDVEIVGLVQDAKYSEVRDEVPPVFFTPYRQAGDVGSMTFYLRTSGDPEHLLGSIPAVVGRLAPGVPVEDLKTLDRQVQENIFMDRMVSSFSAAFAALATLLAAIGLYGVLSYTVAQRTREIGVRMALGASSSAVRGMILRQVGVMLVVGAGIGTVAALALGRYSQSLLFELEGHDPATVVGAAVVLGAVAVFAGYLPARRASRVEPMHALRYE